MGALGIRQRLFGSESAQVATTLSNLGVVEHRAGRNAEAIALLGPAIIVLGRERGELHPEVSRAGVNAAGNLEQARTLFQLAVTAFQASVGENHPDLGCALDGLATVCLLGGDRSEAHRLFTQAVRILSATLGPGHPQTVGSRAKLDQAGASRIELPHEPSDDGIVRGVRDRPWRRTTARPPSEFRAEDLWTMLGFTTEQQQDPDASSCCCARRWWCFMKGR